MFPGRFRTVPDTMWNFGWNPQAMGLQGQFYGGDIMNQQSQAQSQAQTQAQIAALREQNAILNQQLNSQAQSHIQHLQQLIPFHQPPQHVQAQSIPPTPPPSGPQGPEPHTPAATQATQSGPTPSFNPEEMMQQMKNTVESSIQALVDKTQERTANQPPAPHPPAPIFPQNLSHLPPPVEHPPPSHRSSRPISIPRSPRRRRSPRRSRRSSRPWSSSRDLSTPRRATRQPSRVQSITLCSASPHHREERHHAQGHQPPREQLHQSAALQPASWEHNPQPPSYTVPQTRSYHHDHSSTDKWQWRDYSKHSGSSYQSKWIDYSKPSHSHHTPQESSTKPLTAFSSDHTTTSHRHKPKQSATSGDDQPPYSCQCPSRTHGH